MVQEIGPSDFVRHAMYVFSILFLGSSKNFLVKTFLFSFYLKFILPVFFKYFFNLV